MLPCWNACLLWSPHLIACSTCVPPHAPAVHGGGRGLGSVPPVAQQRGQPAPDPRVQREAQVGGERRRGRRERGSKRGGMMAA